MADIFREIDEDIRRDRVLGAFQRYGAWIAAAAILVVVGTAAFVAWQNWRDNRAAQQGLSFFSATELQRAGAADKALAEFNHLGDRGTTGYRLLARIEAAELKAKGSDPAGGLAALRNVAEDTSIDIEYRDLARLVWGFFAVDTEKPDTLIAAMQPLASGATPWRHSAMEITALAQLRAGHRAQAMKIYQTLADDLLAPRSLRARAAEIVSDNKGPT